MYLPSVHTCALNTTCYNQAESAKCQLLLLVLILMCPLHSPESLKNTNSDVFSTLPVYTLYISTNLIIQKHGNDFSVLFALLFDTLLCISVPKTDSHSCLLASVASLQVGCGSKRHTQRNEDLICSTAD